MWLSYTVFLILGYMTVIRSSLVLPDVNCSSSMTLSSISLHRTTHKLMDNLNVSTSPLRCICVVWCMTLPNKWHYWLWLAELWYNSSFHSSIGCSPFRALYGYVLRVGALPDFTNTHSTASEFAADRQALSEALKVHLDATQNRTKT